MEEQLVLRAPPLLAQQLRAAIEAQEGEKSLGMQLIPKVVLMSSGKPDAPRRKYQVRIGKEKYRAEKVPLPSIIETHRTTDGTSLIKSGNVSGMLIVLPNASEVAHEDEAGSQDGMDEDEQGADDEDVDDDDDDDMKTYDQSVDGPASVARSESKRSAASDTRKSADGAASSRSGGGRRATRPEPERPLDGGREVRPPSLPRRAEDLPGVRIVPSGARQQVLDSGLSPPTAHIVRQRFNRARRAVVGGRSRAEIRAAERLLGTIAREGDIVSVQDDLIEPEPFMQALPNAFTVSYLEGQPYQATKLSKQQLQRLSDLTGGRAGAGAIGGGAGAGAGGARTLGATGSVPLALLMARGQQGGGPSRPRSGAAARIPEPSPPLVDVPVASPSMEPQSTAFRAGGRLSEQLRPVSGAMRQSSFESRGAGAGGTPGVGPVAATGGPSPGLGGGLPAGATGLGAGATRLGSVTFQQFAAPATAAAPGGGAGSSASSSGSLSSSSHKAPKPGPPLVPAGSSLRADAATHAMASTGPGDTSERPPGGGSSETQAAVSASSALPAGDPGRRASGAAEPAPKTAVAAATGSGAPPSASPTGSTGLPMASPDSHGAASGGPGISAVASTASSGPTAGASASAPEPSAAPASESAALVVAKRRLRHAEEAFAAAKARLAAASNPLLRKRAGKQAAQRKAEVDAARKAVAAAGGR